MKELENPQATPPLNQFFDLIEGKRYDISPDLITCIRKLFTAQDSTFGLILGKRGTGKTDKALLITEILKTLGIVRHVATNTKIYSSPFPIQHIDNLQDLDYWGANNKGRKVFVFDEIADAMSRRRPMAHMTVELIKKFNKLRKHKLSIVGTTISESVLDSSATDQDLIDFVFNCVWFPKGHSQARKIAHYNNLLTGESITWEGFPRTSVDFDSWDSSPFTETPSISKQQFKDEDMKIVYEWANGKTAKQLDLHPMQLNRKTRKIMKYLFEIYASQHHP